MCTYEYITHKKPEVCLTIILNEQICFKSVQYLLSSDSIHLYTMCLKNSGIPKFAAEYNSTFGTNNLVIIIASCPKSHKTVQPYAIL